MITRKIKQLTDSEILAMFDNIKRTEREGLGQLPESIAIDLQSGYLLGYANCWNKFWNMMTEEKKKS